MEKQFAPEMRQKNDKIKNELSWLGKFCHIRSGLLFTVISAIIAEILFIFHFSDMIDMTATQFYRIAGCLGAGCCFCGVFFTMRSFFIKPVFPDSMALFKLKKGTKTEVILFSLIIPALALYILIIMLTTFFGYFDASVSSVNTLSDLLGPLDFLGAKIILATIAIIPCLFLPYSIINLVMLKRLTKSEKNLIAVNEIAQDRLDEIKSRNSAYDAARTSALEAAGKAAKTPHEYQKERNLKKLPFIFAVVSAGIILFAALAFWRPFFRLQSNVELIGIGDTLVYVNRILGEPADKKDITDSNGKIVSGTWTWCASPIASKIAKKEKQLEKLSEKTDFSEADFEKMAELSEEIFNLELQLSETYTDYIIVKYIVEHNGKEITEIEFKNDCRLKDITLKSVKKTTYSYAYSYARSDSYQNSDKVTVSWSHTETSGPINVELYARHYFDDGGMHSKKIDITLDKASGTHDVTWSDEYGDHKLKIYLELKD